MENDLNSEINEVETSSAQNYDRFRKDLEFFTTQLKEKNQELVE